MRQTSFNPLFCRLAVLFLVVGSFTASLAVGEKTDLKDAAGNTIVRYVVDAPEGIAPAGTTDPAKQVGLFLCFPEHDTDINTNLFAVRQALWRMGLSDDYVVIAAGAQTRKFGPADHEPLSKLIAWAKKTYPVNPRRIYMLGKGEGEKFPPNSRSRIPI